MKKIILFCLLITALLCSGLFVACSEESKPNQEQLPPSAEATYEITAPKNSMVIGEIYVIPIDFSIADNMVITYESSVAEVASINQDGEIEALKAGKTTITRKVNDISANFELNVITDGYLPSIHFSSDFGGTNNVLLNGKLTIKPLIKFNGKIFNDCQASYTIANDSVGSIDQTTGVFTATATAGTTDVTISATWRGFEVESKTITINVTEAVEEIKYDIQAPISELVLDEQWTIPVDFATDGVIAVNYDSSNPEIASIDENGTITSNRLGTATITRKVNGYESSFNLEVTDGGFAPVLEFSSSLRENYLLDTDVELDLNPIINFNGKTFDDYEITITRSNQTVGSIDSGLFNSATTEGETNVTITVSWRGFDDIVKTINVKVVAIETDFGTIYYDGEGTVPFVLPESLSSYDKATLSVVDKVYYDTEKFIVNGEAELETNTTNAKIVKEVLVYSGQTIIGEAELISATKVIQNVEDLKSVYKTVAGSVKGYFVVANDILWDENDKFYATPFYGNYDSTLTTSYHVNASGVPAVKNAEHSRFEGHFDGNGHTIEYGVVSGGLFGAMKSNTDASATNVYAIKNVTFIVKDVDTSLGGNNKFTALGEAKGYSAGKPFILENVFVKYDLPADDIAQIGLSSAFGIFSGSYNVRYTNVILDATCKTGLGALVEADKASATPAGMFGLLGTWHNNVATNTNLYVITDSEYILYQAKPTGKEKTYKAENITSCTRINSYADVTAPITVGSFKITSTGVTKA